MLPEGGKVISVQKGLSCFPELRLLQFVYDGIDALYSPIYQVPNTHADTTPIYGELYLLPTTLVQKRLPLPHMKVIAAVTQQQK